MKFKFKESQRDDWLFNLQQKYYLKCKPPSTCIWPDVMPSKIFVPNLKIWKKSKNEGV
jgi:hypothetical protein